MNGRLWTTAEDNYIRKHYGRISAERIGKKLNRTARAVFQRANLLECVRRQVPSRVIVKAIRKYNPLGYSDSDIANLTKPKSDRHRVSKIRKKLGLPCNKTSDRFKSKIRSSLQSQCAKAGVSNLGELRSKEMKRIARRFGWPESLSLRAVQILECLYRRGPMTRRQIAVAIQVPWRGKKTFGNKRVPGQSYLAELQHADLVVRIPKAIKGRGKGKTCDLYVVAPGVAPSGKE